MITDVLLERPWLPTTALVAFVVLGPVVGRWLVARPRLAWWLAGFSLLPVAFLTFVPTGRELTTRCAVQWSFPTPGRVELMANVVLFIAPVLLVSVATRHPVFTLIAGSAVSVAVEALQALVPAIGRSCDTTDWLSNTIGAVIGSLLAMAALGLAASDRQISDDRPG